MVYNYTIPRGPVAAMFSSPGPIYLLPSLTGRKFHDPRSVHNRGPAYPFGVRHKMYKDDSSPGPCYYPHPKMLRDGREGIPKYTMLARHPDVEQFQSPGPAAYKPLMRSAVERPPEYSFGVKHMEFRKDNIPGPNQYTLPPMLGRTVDSSKWSAPNYSIAEKLGDLDHFNTFPGPGTYLTVSTNQYMNRPPQYTMAARVFIPGDRTTKPGPGAHYPELVKANRLEPPHFSFGIRHSQYEGTMTGVPVDDVTSLCL